MTLFKTGGNNMTFEEYKLKVQTDLINLSVHIKPIDIKQVQMNISSAKTIGHLDSISLGLNLHKFRVEERGKV